MRIIGLVIHRAFAEAVAWKDGRLTRLGRVIMRRESLQQLSNSDIVIIEATGNAAAPSTWWPVERLRRRLRVSSRI
jgi:transposase